MPKNTIREKIYKDWNCSCDGENLDHTYSRSTEQFADYIIALFDSLLAEKEKEVRRLFKEFEKEDIVPLENDIMDILNMKNIIKPLQTPSKS